MKIGLYAALVVVLILAGGIGGLVWVNHNLNAKYEALNKAYGQQSQANAQMTQSLAESNDNLNQLKTQLESERVISKKHQATFESSNQNLQAKLNKLKEVIKNANPKDCINQPGPAGVASLLDDSAAKDNGN